MPNHTPTLSDHDVLAHAREGLSKHLPLAAAGYKCTTNDLLNVLLGVAANRGTVESVCNDLVGTPAAATLRGYFNEELCVEDLPELARRLNAAMGSEIPPRVWQQRCDVAMDFQDRPYYGKMSQATGLWVRGRARDRHLRCRQVWHDPFLPCGDGLRDAQQPARDAGDPICLGRRRDRHDCPRPAKSPEKAEDSREALVLG